MAQLVETPDNAASDNAVAGALGDDAPNENKFQRAIASWRSLDLTKLVSSLDTTAEELVNHQKDALVQRKELAQKTKDFRKMDDTAKLGEIKDLLKAYQSYVDVLTTHSKSVSSAFMQVYSPLSEAPDPYPLLEASVESLVTTEEVVPKLEKENDQLRKQVSTLEQQLQETEQALTTESGKRQELQDGQDAKMKEVEASWSAVVKEKESNWESKEQSLEEKVENQERLLKELKASYEVSQRLEKKGDDADGTAPNLASAAELDMLNSELERKSSRLAEMEARNEQLRLELAQSASQSHSSERNKPVEEEPAYLRLRSENSSLLRKMESLRNEKDSSKGKVEAKLRSLEREVSASRAEREALQSKIQKWSDYDEIKQELDMLRAIEFATVDDADLDGEDLVQANGSADGSGKASLESLLLARNKKLSNELIELRVSHNELQDRMNSLQKELGETKTDLEEARNLNATLENDLQKAQQEASNAFETMSVAGTYTSRYPKSAYGSRRGGGISPTSSIIGGFEGASAIGSPRAGDGASAGPGILPMVTAQRDRFKKKIGELEQELQKQYSTVTSLRSEVASLQRDNLNLYEKTRYVSTYNRSGQPATSGASYGANPANGSRAGPGEVGSPSVDRYRSAYEQSMSPFAAFRGRESARAMKRMNVGERAVFQVTRMVLATRTSRNLFAVYCVGLHVLVLAMLYWSSTAEMEQGGNIRTVGSVGSGGSNAGGAVWQPEGFQQP